MGIYIFVIAVIVLSVVRLVNSVRQKKQAQEPAAAAPRKPKKKRKAAAPAAQTVAPLAEVMAKQETAAVPQAPTERFPDNLSYLSPLKRAVVLTEILGKPKGLE
jgi:hypothetical protein